MSREDMLQALGNVPFAFIDPQSEWEDMGFTERPIWVNAKGYGYIMCDEPCSTLIVDGVPFEKWQIILSKISNGTLQKEDIKDTSVSDLFEEVTHGYFDDDEDSICDVLSGLVQLPWKPIDHIYGVETFDGWEFFSTEEAFKKAYERDWAEVLWEDLDDSLLIEWIDRLSVESDPDLAAWSLKYTLAEECNDSGAYEIIETGEYKNYWTAHNTRDFSFCSSTVVYEGKQKRYVTLTATGDNKRDKPQTVLKIVSTRKDVVGSFVIAGADIDGISDSSNIDLGKWETVKNHLYLQLINLIVKIAGNDPYARSLPLFYGIKEALNTAVLDDLIKDYENRSTCNE